MTTKTETSHRTGKEVHHKAKHLHEEVKKATRRYVILTVWDDTATKILTKEDGTVINNWPFSDVVGVYDSPSDAKHRLKKEAGRIEEVMDDDGNNHWLVYTKEKPLTPAYMIASYRNEE